MIWRRKRVEESTSKRFTSDNLEREQDRGAHFGHTVEKKLIVAE